MEHFETLQPQSTFTPQGWMRMGLGLTGNDAWAYAIIFNQSQAQNMTGEKLRDHIAEWCDIKPHSALRIINRLINQGLVTCQIELLIGNKQLRRYRVTDKYKQCIQTLIHTPQAPCAGDKSIIPLIKGQEAEDIIDNNNNEEEKCTMHNAQCTMGGEEKGFMVPTKEEIAAYCSERGNGIDPEQVWDYYQAKGWKVGKSPMQDWKAAIRTWERKKRRQTTGYRIQEKQRKTNNEIDNA